MLSLATIAFALTVTGAGDPRPVEFTYRPGRALDTVAVVGQFNNWDRAAFPLRLQPDGSTWSGTFPIAPGVYQYLFCEDNRRWVPDPNAPPAPDANGNRNSRLIVLPFSYDGKPGVRGDGVLTLEAIEHRPSPADTVRRNAKMASVRLRIRADDAERVSIRVGGSEHPMGLRESTPLVDEWQGEFPIPAGTARYSFVVVDGPRRHEVGPFTQDLAKYPLPSPPAWVQDAVFYQIFPERFENGDPANDGPGVVPWGTPPTGRNRMGGDLAGIRKRLDHLAELGVSGLYLNPVFEALSNHAYDTVDYTKVDHRFGTNEDLRGLVADAHRQGVRVILDAVFNHSSPEFFAFRDLREKGEASAYRSWYHVLRLPIVVGEGQQTYRTFAGVPSMPKLDTDDPGAAAYLNDVGTRWIREAGIDGWRLDVADEVSQAFWRKFRVAVRGAKKDAYILGEAWGDAHEYLQGDQHDAVMNYRWRKPALDYAGGTIDGPALDAALRQVRDDYPDAVLHTMFNLLGSHDTERVRTVLKGDLARVRLAFGLQFAYPGVPSVYYGDEIGMVGGRDPDQRRAMIWDRAQWDMGLFELTKRLIALRREHPALRRGGFRLIAAEGGVFAFERRSGRDVVRAAFNNGPAPATVSVAGRVLAGDGATASAGRLTLPPLGWAILAR